MQAMQCVKHANVSVNLPHSHPSNIQCFFVLWTIILKAFSAHIRSCDRIFFSKLKQRSKIGAQWWKNLSYFRWNVMHCFINMNTVVFSICNSWKVSFMGDRHESWHPSQENFLQIGAHLPFFLNHIFESKNVWYDIA